MRKWLVLSSLVLLAACGNSNDISKSDLQKALDHSPHGKVCVPVALEIADRQGDEISTLGQPEIRVLKRLENGKRANQRAIEQMDILVQAGIYEEVGVQKSDDANSPVRHLVYRLTDKGRSVFQHRSHGLSLCIGRLEVEKIHYYTQPTPSNGVTMSMVSYEATIQPERWARKLLANSPYYQGLTQAETRNITLVQTNAGWREIHSLY
ncbi:MAG: hypothetical protein Q4B82_06735 [Alysiella sp.]|uniref:hypothetical protein n=1 Tax=Alysiella sp. TaxID=1872483 RepID=UPI0026DC223E|nr:hypothetical protein [Alysiella sp.]MDO4434259.1 hypothetical protein [Alysiella sp.]